MKIKNIMTVCAAISVAATLACDSLFSDMYDETTRETVYIGGDFTTVGGFTQSFVAVLESNNGNLVNWPVNIAAQVYAIAVSGDRVFLGGNGYLNVIDRKTGGEIATISFAGIIYALSISGDVLYVGGNFPSIGGHVRNGIAALDLSTLQVTEWNPNCLLGVGPGDVETIAIRGNTVYFGGSFDTVGGQTRNNLAAVDDVSGALKSWNPDSGAQVYSILIADDAVYLGGGFGTIGGISRPWVAAVDLNAGLVNSWAPDVGGGEVFSMVIVDDVIYLGGNLTTVSGLQRNRAAAVNRHTGALLSWNPNINSTVRGIDAYNNTIYMVGTFATVGSITRNNAAAVDMDLGRVLPWNPNVTIAGNGIETIVIDR